MRYLLLLRWLSVCEMHAWIVDVGVVERWQVKVLWNGWNIFMFSDQEKLWKVSVSVLGP